MGGLTTSGIDRVIRNYARLPHDERNPIRMYLRRS